MEKLVLEDFTKYKFISNTKFSPNGKNLAFVVSEMDVDENKYLSNIWLYNVDNKTINKLTAFNQESSYVWLDDENIIFSTVREEKDKKRKEKGEPFTIYYIINIKGGEAQKYFELPFFASDIEPISKDKFVVTGIYDPKYKNLENLSKEEKEKELDKLKEEKDYEVLDEIPFWSNGKGFTNKKRNRLYIYTLEDKKVTPITDELTNVEGFKLNKEKDLMLFISNTFKDKMEIRSDLYLYQLRICRFSERENNLLRFQHERVRNQRKPQILFDGFTIKRSETNSN